MGGIEMSVTDKQYLILSNISYGDFNFESQKNKTIGELFDNHINNSRT